MSLSDRTQDQRQVLTSLMAHRNRVLADYRLVELREVYLEIFCSTILSSPLPDMVAEKPSWYSTRATWTIAKDIGSRTRMMALKVSSKQMRMLSGSTTMRAIRGSRDVSKEDE